MTDHELPDTTFLDRLKAADPVDPATLPTGEEPEARRLLDGIVTAEPIAAQRSRAVGAVAARTLGRGRAMLVASAAAVLLLVGAVAVLAPDNTPSAVAEVHEAAAATAAADTGRIETTFTLVHEGTSEPETVAGAFEAVYNGRDLGVTLGFDQLPGPVDAEMLAELPAFEDIRLVDDVIYAQQDGQWMSIDTDGLLGSMVNRIVDPRTVLDTVQGLTETTELGSVEIDGVDTTHYRSVVDLGDESLSQSGWLAFEAMAVEADGQVTIDLYVDGDGVLRRFDLSGDVREPVEGGESGVFEVTTTFSDIGSDIEIEAPEGAVAFNPLEDMFDE